MQYKFFIVFDFRDFFGIPLVYHIATATSGFMGKGEGTAENGFPGH